MQMNQVVRSNQETFDRLDQSSVLRGINQHFWYNGYTMGDFTVKSQLLMATYHGYKYVDGKLIILSNSSLPMRNPLFLFYFC